MTTHRLEIETLVPHVSSNGGDTLSTDQTLRFTNVLLTTVKPLQKTAHVDTIDPTSLDLPSADAFVPVFFAYRPNDKSEASHSLLVTQLKESLQKVLVPFFSFAGRWIESPLGSSGRKLLCNDDGVPFVEAYLDKDLVSIVHASGEFQPVPELQGYDVVGMDMTRRRQDMQPGGLPCIFIQVTRFKCGGVVLAVTFNHMHTDGKGCFTFMRAWSDLFRTTETTVIGEHSRALADPESFKSFLVKPKANETSGADGIDGHDRPAKLDLSAMRLFEVNASTVRSLKQDAKGNKVGPGFVSTGDCILAHLWKALTRLSSSMLGDRELAITMAVEGRSKFFDPPLPNLCGNAVVALVAPRIPPSELQEMPVASIASKFREKLHTTTKEQWFSWERMEEAFMMSRSNKFAVVRVTSWFSFPMYDIDFGFGKPYFAVGLNSRLIFRGTGTTVGAYIGPPIPSSSSSVASLSLWSSPELFEVLECDPEFLSLFLRCGKGSERKYVHKHYLAH